MWLSWSRWLSSSQARSAWYWPSRPGLVHGSAASIRLMVILTAPSSSWELGHGMQRQQQVGDVEARRERVKGTGEIDGGAGACHCEGRRLPGPGQERQAPDQVSAGHGELLGDVAAERVADDVAGPEPEVFDQGRSVGGHVGNQVRGGWCLGTPAASVVEGDDGVPGCGQVGHLGEPQVGRLAGAAGPAGRRRRWPLRAEPQEPRQDHRPT